MAQEALTFLPDSKRTKATALATKWGKDFTPLETRTIHGHRWCDEDTIAELVEGGETVYPLQLGELLAEANAMAAPGSTGPARQPQSIR